MKVATILAKGFEDVEALMTIDLLKRAGIEVDLISLDEVLVSSSSNILYQTDKQLSEVEVEDYDLLFLPGGKGVQVLDKSVDVKNLVLAFHNQEKYIAAICAAPSILGKLTLLDHRVFTCYPGFEQHMPNGVYKEVPVIQDGHIITGRGVAYASDFGLYLVELLINKVKRQEVQEKTLFTEKEKSLDY